MKKNIIIGSLTSLIAILVMTSCNYVSKPKTQKIVISLEDSLVLNAKAGSSFSNHVFFFKNQAGYYFIDYNSGPKYGVFDSSHTVTKVWNLNIPDAYNVNIVHDTFYVSTTNAIIMLSDSFKNRVGFAPKLTKDQYIYSVMGHSGFFYRDDKFWCYQIPDNTIWPKVELCRFALKGNLLTKVDTVFSFPSEMKDTFHYQRFGDYDMDNEGNVYYCFSSYNYVYKKGINRIDSVDLEKILPAFRPSPFPIDSFYNIPFILNFGITRPSIWSLKYDKFRNLIYLFVKMGQPLEDKEGNLNDQNSADLYWVILDTTLKEKAIKKLKKNYYIDMINPLINEKGVGFKRKLYDHKKVIFDIYSVRFR